ncbi:MAG: FeoC-like transcriptional regulator [Rhodocyclaceae bacterium]|nr:FeoC-like transcriptional regulator [Rhodocyclaceae bacterium]
MIIERLSAYLNRHRRASLNQLSIALAASPDALRPMLAHLERKGRVEKLPPPRAACGSSCCRCDRGALEAWRWADGSADDDAGCPGVEQRPGT